MFASCDSHTVRIMEVLIAAIVGLVTGAIGSLVAPWVNWGVEKKRLIRQDRRALIDEVRRQINPEVGRGEFATSAIYARIRMLLSEGTRNHIEASGQRVVIGSGMTQVNPYVKELQADLHRLECEWELI